MARAPSPLQEDDPEASAAVAGLRYVTDDEPGYRRRRRGRGFQYLTPGGDPLADRRQLARIRALAIPPAWTDVWICRSPDGHLQATGRDARGRKQYRYHPRWTEVRDESKFHRMLEFGRALPRIRRRVAADLRRPGLPRDKVLAAVVRLLDATAIRVGNDAYARENGSFGLTTMRDRHVRVRGPRMRFRFRGKGGRTHDVELTDAHLARIVSRCQDLPGQHLFQYEDEDGEPVDVGSDDVNAYLQDIAGAGFTAKDFRTWAGTVLAAGALRELGAHGSQTQARSQITAAVASVAQELRNTPAVCRRCYVHPEVIGAHLDGTLQTELGGGNGAPAPARTRLSRPESAVLALLRRRACARG